jgi:nucleolar GTP-binding protein
MVVYNFKKIQVVPAAKEFVDIVLTRTQRKTPTVIHPNFNITRIRHFYMRKVKFTQQTFNEKFTQILEDFPKLDEIHPFYADLINVLYDRDHYKLALGQLNTAKGIIDNIGKDYVRLLKYGDNAFRCKQLKRSALGRMCTLMRKLGPSLEYLEEVRKHLSRLPSIDPNTRNIIITGYPNVGKSSFMNLVTRADVEVQPFAFTTKGLFVGHLDYNYQRWQVIDTPGILDRPLEERNTTEMQSVTALAHLTASVLYFIDLSERCGYSIDEQVALFDSIKPLFHGKPLVVVGTKTDDQPWETLEADKKELINAAVEASGAAFLTMSNHTEEGVSNVKNKACEMLLSQRVESKMQSKRVGNILNRLTVTMPKPRDNKSRPSAVPDSVLAGRAARGDVDMDGAGAASAPSKRTHAVGMTSAMPMGVKQMHIGAGGYSGPVVGTGKDGKVLERDIEAAAGGPGVYKADYRKRWDLKVDEWAYDKIPEIMDGKNVADFLSPGVWEQLLALEAEEEARVEEEAAGMGLEDEESEQDEDEAELASAIRRRKAIAVNTSRRERGKNRTNVSRKAAGVERAELEDHLKDLGIEPEMAGETARAVGSKRRGRSLVRRGYDDDGADDMMEMEGGEAPARSKSRADRRKASIAKSVAPIKPGEGIQSKRAKVDSEAIGRRTQLQRQRKGWRVDSDRLIGNLRPKHLLSGKRGIGKTDRR